MATLTMTPGTLKQSSLDKVGAGNQYEEIFFSAPDDGTKGIYTVKDPLKLNSGTIIDGDPNAVITLMPCAPISTFHPGVPLFGQTEKKIENIIIRNIHLFGNAKKQDVPHGKGYHNFFGFTHAFDILVENITAESSQGDLLRLADSKDILYKNNTVLGIGHDGLYGERCTNMEALENTTYIRVNSAHRCKGSTDVRFHDNKIFSTSDYTPAFCPGIQVENSDKGETCSEVEIYNNIISGTNGPGIWGAGNTVKDNNVASGLKIHNNIIRNCGNMIADVKIPGVGGIVIDGWTDVEIAYNTIDSCRGYGVLFGSYRGQSAESEYEAVVKNNIITRTKESNYPGSKSGGGIINLLPNKYAVTATRNCLYGNVINSYNVHVSGQIDADPLYVGEGDFHLKSDSPCIFSDSELGAYHVTPKASKYDSPDFPQRLS